MTYTGGAIEYGGSLIIKGQVINSSIRQRGKDVSTVIIDLSGMVNTDMLTADFIVVRGKLNGNVNAKIKLVVESTGVINGDVIYGELKIAEGGVLNGNIQQTRYSASTSVNTIEEENTNTQP